MFDAQSAGPLLELWQWRPSPEEKRDPDTGLAVVAYGRNLPPALVVETLLDLLAHEHAAVGKAAVAELLRRYTPDTESGTLGYNAASGATARSKAVAEWRSAWANHRESFR